MITFYCPPLIQLGWAVSEKSGNWRGAARRARHRQAIRTQQVIIGGGQGGGQGGGNGGGQGVRQVGDLEGQLLRP